MPYALPWKRGFPEPRNPPPVGVAFGVLALGAALGGAALARRRRALWTALALFGFFWALFIRDSASSVTRDFEGLFYVGIPLALFGTALMGARRLWGERAPVMAALAATALFAVSAFQMGGLDRNSEKAETVKAERADFDAIPEKTRGAVVVVSSEVVNMYFKSDSELECYLAGGVLAKGEVALSQMGRAEYVVSRRPDYEGLAALTPENSGAFLYAVEPLGMLRAALRRVESVEPAARSDFDVYLAEGGVY